MRILFFRRRSLFGLKEGAQELTQEVSTLASLAWASKGALILSFAVATSLQLSNSYTQEIAFVAFDKEPYATFLATIAATGGVLIGLYYAATTAIAGAIYAQVPNNIRNLFARERVGSVYLRFLAFLTFTSLILLALQASDFKPVKIAPLLLTFFGGIAVVGFGVLGVRAFNLFDPTILSQELIGRLLKSVERCTPGHYRWLDAPFQNHARIVAREALDTINTLAQLSQTNEQLSGRPFVDFCKYQIATLVAYSRQKKKIPIDSKWYPVQYEYRDWYWTEDSTTTLLHQTASRQHPKEVTDSQWIETEVLKIIHDCVSQNVTSGKRLLAVELIAALNSYTTTLCREHEAERSLEVVEKLALACAKEFFDKPAVESERAQIEQIALADALGSLLIGIYLSYREAAVNLSKDDLRKKLSAVSWKSKGNIYRSDFPQFIFHQLEWLRTRIDFEMKSEGERVTPNWYVEEMVLLPAVDNAKKSILVLSERIPALFKSWSALAEKNNLPWVRAVIIARHAEYCSKFRASFSDIRTRWENLNQQRRIEGLTWATIDIATIDKAWIENEKALFREMASSAISLGKIDRPIDYPDFGGQFLHTTGEHFLAACIDNDTPTVEAMFRALFDGCLEQYSRLILKRNDPAFHENTAMKVAISPLLDLMHLTGYCILFGERFENPELSRNVESIWDRYITDRYANKFEVLKFLAAAISFTEGAFEMAHRSIVRTNWSLRVSQSLHDIPETEEVIGRQIPAVVSHPVHSSALVRIFARRRMGLHYDGLHVFIERIAKLRPEAAGVEFRHGALDLGDAIRREEKRAKAPPKEDGDDGL